MNKKGLKGGKNEWKNISNMRNMGYTSNKLAIARLLEEIILTRNVIMNTSKTWPKGLPLAVSAQSSVTPGIRLMSTWSLPFDTSRAFGLDKYHLLWGRARESGGQVNLVSKWVWWASESGGQVSLAGKWVWRASESCGQVSLAGKWVWRASESGGQVSLAGKWVCTW